MYNTIGNGGDIVNLGNFSLERYWSSSPNGNQRSRCINFENGLQTNEHRYYANSVRVIRAF